MSLVNWEVTPAASAVTSGIKLETPRESAVANCSAPPGTFAVDLDKALALVPTWSYLTLR